ncbi:MAG: plastocyanin [Jaaginema sp. PMC 1079.18]|nr:plastocyanin [Jaaginema sp. PMC 1080.18]MEC4850336.1 plastocyanin [Jaaginema sp. PMC 1079.18]MEC4865589.1 plastocyanin [Jaaginema sp. PMC 1078.18]
MMNLKTTLQKAGLLLSVALMAIATFAFSATPALAETFEVKMGADNGMLQFVPDKLEVNPGDTVKFVINKVPPHNVVFDKVPGNDTALAKSLSNEPLLFSPGQSVSVTIPGDAPSGAYQYYCQPHRGAGMNGKLIVK